MLPWLLLAVTLVALLALHVGVLALVSHRAGLQPTAVRLGFGPIVASWTRDDVEIELRAVLLGGSVSNEHHETAPLPRALAPGVAASLTVLAVGVLMIGPAASFAFVGDAVAAMVAGGLSPSGEAQRILADTIAAIGAGPYLAIAGRAAVLFGVTNFALAAWTPLFRSKPMVQMLVLLLPIVVALPWAFAWLIYLF